MAKPSNTPTTPKTSRRRVLQSFGYFMGCGTIVACAPTPATAAAVPAGELLTPTSRELRRALAGQPKWWAVHALNGGHDVDHYGDPDERARAAAVDALHKRVTDLEERIITEAEGKTEPTRQDLVNLALLACHWLDGEWTGRWAGLDDSDNGAVYALLKAVLKLGSIDIERIEDVWHAETPPAALKAFRREA